VKTDIQPYRVTASRRTVGEITDQYNDALYRSYGPDHSLKSGPVQITVDALCEYERLLDTVVEIGAEGVPLAEMHDTPCPADKIICGIRHDLDMDFRASLEMARLEQERGIRTSWYILHTAPYYGQLDGEGVFHRNESMAAVYLQLQEMGHEVGLHIDPLHLYQNEKIDGAEALLAELEWMRAIGLDIVGSAAHNMVATYGAENYAIYKGRPLSGGELKGDSPTEVVKGGKWAPVGLVDELEHGLTYEANDLFHQGHTSVYYAATRGLDQWRRVGEMSAPRAGKSDDLGKGFTDAATVLREMRAVEKGKFIILAVHPIYYGARHSPQSGPSQFCSLNGSTSSVDAGWPVYPPGEVQARYGKRKSGAQEFQAINLANEKGQLDKPFAAADESASARILFLGSRNVDGASVGLPAHCHLRVRDALEADEEIDSVQLWKFARPELGVSRLFSFYESEKETCRPTHLVMGIGGDELLRSLPGYWSMVCGTDPGLPAGSYLAADSENRVKTIPSAAGAKVARGVPQAVPDDAPLLHRNLSSRHKKDLSQLESVLSHCQDVCRKDGVKLVLFLENCGETVDLRLLEGDGDELERAHRHAIHILQPLCDRLEICLVDPYLALLEEKEDAFYESVPEWSPRGHALAARILAKELSAECGESAKFALQRSKRVRSAQPLTTESRPSIAELESMAEAAEQAGVRPVPYPFANAMTVTSDIDKSNREKYEAYIDALVKDFGLDFGDSVWLTASFPGKRRKQRHTGMAFFSPWLTHFESIWPEAGVLDSFELIREHHLGNVDHWHSFLRRGPRCAILKSLERQDDGSFHGVLPPAVDPRPVSDNKFGRDYYDTRDFYVVAATVIGTWGSADAPDSLVVKDADGGDSRFEMGSDPLDALAGLEKSHRCFIAKIAPGDAQIVPHLDKVESIQIGFSKEDSTATVDRVILHNIHPDLFADRFDYLAKKYHFSTNLVSRHSLFHFLPAIPGFGGKAQGRVNRERMEEFPEILDTYYGSLFDQGFEASSSADESGSFAQVYPRETQVNGLRFLRTVAIDYPTTLRTAAAQKAHALREGGGAQKAATSNDPVESESPGWHPSVFGVAFPTPTRTGGALYHLRSTHSRLSDKEAAKSLGKAVAKKTTARTFTNRLRTVIDDLKGKKARAAQFYTHLGNLAPDDEVLPDPYFDQNDLREFQDRVFGCGQDRSDHRIWFTRGTVLSDYSLVLQSIGHHTKRPDENTVSITSWTDPYAGIPVARNFHQLYGQTFYVDDSSEAQVNLNEEELSEIVRNPADESGKQSVTIAESTIRHTVFRAIDPQKRGSVEAENCAADWTGEAFSLSPADSSAGKVTIIPESIYPVGTQHLIFRIRRISADSRFALVFETKTGGRFAFGDSSMISDVDGFIDAKYDFASAFPTDDSWQTCVVPFYDLEWATADLSADAVRPLPSHEPASIQFQVSGDGVEIDHLEYTRPKTTAPNSGHPDSVKIGVRCEDSRSGRIFELRSVADDSVAATASPNEVGHLIFDAVPKGGYRLIASAKPDETLHWIEAFADRFDLVL
jgi:hypothetical protein